MNALQGIALTVFVCAALAQLVAAFRLRDYMATRHGEHFRSVQRSWGLTGRGFWNFAMWGDFGPLGDAELSRKARTMRFFAAIALVAFVALIAGEWLD